MLPNKQKTPDAAKAVIGQFPASVMTLALLAKYVLRIFPQKVYGIFLLLSGYSDKMYRVLLQSSEEAYEGIHVGAGSSI